MDFRLVSNFVLDNKPYYLSFSTPNIKINFTNLKDLLCVHSIFQGLRLRS